MSPGSTGLSNNVLLAVRIIFSSVNRRLVGVYAAAAAAEPASVAAAPAEGAVAAAAPPAARCLLFLHLPPALQERGQDRVVRSVGPKADAD